jgi:predicted glycosyltransferase/RimJ/RimL family protein N-acetyltransferase
VNYNGAGDDFDGWFDYTLERGANYEHYPFAVRRRADGVVIGTTRFYDLVPDHKRLAIGSTWYTVGARGTLINSEVRLLTLTYAFETLSVNRVELITDPFNLSSRAAMKILGAVEEGLIRNHMIYKDGRIRDSVLFSIVKSEWPSVREKLVKRLGYAEQCLSLTQAPPQRFDTAPQVSQSDKPGACQASQTLQVVDGPQKRAIFFVFDSGTGVGHLRRLACIARRLQGRLACLIVTGHRAAAHWFVPEQCEYVHLPSWDSLLESKASYWGRKPFLSVSEQDAIRLRCDILKGVVAAFRPDAIFVDHLPLGARDELADVIRDTPCRKYLVTRGVLNQTEDLGRLILGGKAHEYLRTYYHKILVAADPKVFEFSKRYNISPEIREKIVHTGYVTEGMSKEIIQKTRDDRGLKEGDLWVVASAGGGQMGEPLIEACLELAATRHDVVFDIVQGPRSRRTWEAKHQTVIVRNNLRLHKETDQMPLLNAAADLVISSSGYNSLLETLQGNAKVLCFPYRKDLRDEQYQHAVCLKKFVDLEVTPDLSQLPMLFDRAITSIRCCPGTRDRREELALNGAACIEKIVLGDLR